MNFRCDQCAKTFTSKSALHRHCKECHPPSKAETVKESENLPSSASNKRKRNVNDDDDYGDTSYCESCVQHILRNRLNAHLRTNEHKRKACASCPEYPGVEVIRSAFKDNLVTYRFAVSDKILKVPELLASIKSTVRTVYVDRLKLLTSAKVNFELFGLYLLDTQQLTAVKSFQTAYSIVSVGNDFDKLYEEAVGVLDRKESDFIEKGSGWTLANFLYLEMNALKFNSTNASSYVELPKCIASKKAVINVQNTDECCFGWAVTSALFPTQHNSHRTSSYPDFRQVFDWTGIHFPVELTAIPTFERQNAVSVNVYGLEAVYEGRALRYEVAGPLYYSKNKKDVHVNLLLIDDGEGNHHYCWIKNFSRLLSSQLSKHKCKKYFCDGCLNYFSSADRLQKHASHECNHVYTKLPGNEVIINKLGEPQLENIVQFKNFQNQLMQPFVVYADFESYMIPIQTVENDPTKPFTIQTCSHRAYSWAYYIKSSVDDSWSRFRTYRGENAFEEFVTHLEADILEIYAKYWKYPKSMEALTEDQTRQHESAAQCFICQRPFSGDNVKVRDHCHLSGKYRGAAHSNCNLNFRLARTVQIVFHNLSGYDSHLFIKQLAKKSDDDMYVIPNSMEKYVSFGKKLLVDRISKDDGKDVDVYVNLRFIDSFRFLPSSLDVLAKNLDADQCVELRKFFPEHSKFSLVRCKGIFPYTYLDGIDKLAETSLPAYERFYNILSGENITREQYDHAQNVWSTFDCGSLGEYSDIYVKCDVLILADVFENFRKLCFGVYGLDPAHYVTTPGLTWDAMLHHSKIQLTLLTDIEMCHFFKRGIRGGVSMCVKRQSCANNEHVKNYDPNLAKKFIMYLDATNLYGHSMRGYLPISDFSWLDAMEIQNFDVARVGDEDEFGYVLEVDLRYPSSLHDRHNDLPFCPENAVPPNSKFNQKKLITTLHDKQNYVIHYRNLKQCIDHGLELVTIHRALKSRQSPWLRGYIDLNTELRNKASNKFEKDFYKLMNNGCFGKTMENVDKRKNIKLISHWEKRGKRLGMGAYVGKPHFKRFSQFDDEFFGVELSKMVVTYNKPIYAGFTVLDNSKTVIYRFFYDVLRAQFGQNARLLYTDTDSLVVEVETDNFYRHMQENQDEYDTSNFSSENIHDVTPNKSEVGKMKDEFGGRVVERFSGCGAKCYCVSVSSSPTIKKAKGVTRAVIKHDLTEADFRRVATSSDSSILCKMYTFRSTLHEIHTVLMNKIALTSKDDKRSVLENGVDTLSWGHFRLVAPSPDDDDDDDDGDVSTT